jgi:hypothetical protein
VVRRGVMHFCVGVSALRKKCSVCEREEERGGGRE